MTNQEFQLLAKNDPRLAISTFLSNIGSDENTELEKLESLGTMPEVNYTMHGVGIRSLPFDDAPTESSRHMFFIDLINAEDDEILAQMIWLCQAECTV